MPEDKSDMRIVAKPPHDGSPPVGLRLTKTVRGRDESLYVFMLPGVVPDPLKLSIHPSGEIQLKAKGPGLITRLNRDALIESLASGSLDASLAKFLTPKLPTESAEGFVVPPDVLPLQQVGAGEPLSDVDLSVEHLLRGMTKVEVDDLSELPRAIAWLRAQGHLPPKSMLSLVSESSDRPIYFVSLLDGSLTNAPEKVPDGLPFPKTLQSVLDGLRTYGGLLLTMPDERELREMANVIGLGDLFGALDRLSTSLEEPTTEAKVRATWEGIEPDFAAPAKALARAKPLRPPAYAGQPKRTPSRDRRSSSRPRPIRRVESAGN